MEFLAVSWSNVFSFRLERQWLSSSKRKDPNITALKSKSGECTPLFSSHPCTSSKSCAHSGEDSNISLFRSTKSKIFKKVKTQTILVITTRPCCPRASGSLEKHHSAAIHRLFQDMTTNQRIPSFQHTCQNIGLKSTNSAPAFLH